MFVILLLKMRPFTQRERETVSWEGELEDVEMFDDILFLPGHWEIPQLSFTLAECRTLADQCQDAHMGRPKTTLPIMLTF